MLLAGIHSDGLDSFGDGPTDIDACDWIIPTHQQLFLRWRQYKCPGTQHNNWLVHPSLLHVRRVFADVFRCLWRHQTSLEDQGQVEKAEGAKIVSLRSYFDEYKEQIFNSKRLRTAD